MSNEIERKGYGRRKAPHADGPCIQIRCIEVIKGDIKTLEKLERDFNSRLSTVEQISKNNKQEIDGVQKILTRIFVLALFTSISVVVTLGTLLYQHIAK